MLVFKINNLIKLIGHVTKLVKNVTVRKTLSVRVVSKDISLNSRQEV
jgi:hypothetical protein